MSKRLIAHAAILLANLIYGVNYSVAKPIMPDYVHPIGLAVFRALGALSLFWVLSLFIKQKVNKTDALRLMACGVFGVALNQMLFLKGLNLTTPIDASIIMVSNPILVLIASSIILKEKVTWFKAFGIVFGAAGALLLILKGGYVNFTGDHFKGNLLVFLNATSYGIYLVLVKPLVTKYHPVTVMKWVFLAGSLVVAPFGINHAIQVDWQSMPITIFGAILFVVLGTTFLAFLLNIFAMKQVSPTTVSIYIYLQPVISSVTAIFLKQDQLTPIKIASTLLVFIGVYLVSVPRNTLKSKIRILKNQLFK